MSISFYEDNAEWFFQRTVNVDMSTTQSRAERGGGGKRQAGRVDSLI